MAGTLTVVFRSPWALIEKARRDRARLQAALLQIGPYTARELAIADAAFDLAVTANRIRDWAVESFDPSRDKEDERSRLTKWMGANQHLSLLDDIANGCKHCELDVKRGKEKKVPKENRAGGATITSGEQPTFIGYSVGKAPEEVRYVVLVGAIREGESKPHAFVKITTRKNQRFDLIDVVNKALAAWERKLAAMKIPRR